jgi:hypothetical protein
MGGTGTLSRALTCTKIPAQRLTQWLLRVALICATWCFIKARKTVVATLHALKMLPSFNIGCIGHCPMAIEES